MGWRALLGLPLAGAVVMAIFLFMADLIKVEELPPPLDKLPPINMPEVQPDTEIDRTKPVKPDNITPPPPPVTDDRRVDPVTTTDETITVDTEVDSTLDPTGLPVNREAIPIVTTNPQGFENCFDRGDTEHRVVVGFDISPQGEPANIEVISSTDSCFERPAKRAIQRWRFQAKLDQGEPVWQYGMRYTLVFQLEE
ncbi:TonB family protein [Parvularcula sp. ZS-1/3]|uniref:TonB family protein n=1 Tax=Parvularcula mediterranea TaxID=2732508 RepID=A0A7Y3RJK0_9PROT|nr:energy transducer TonB [Parvularcula mediterranea]NNU14711.1 TonB family protein [Parvularcula mediterranea]